MIYDPNSYRDLQEIDNIWKTQKEKSSILSDGRKRKEAARAEARTPADSPRCAATLRARPYSPEGSETRTCLEHRRPPATCTSLLGRALAAWENTSKLPGTRTSLSRSPRIIPVGMPRRSSTSLIRLRILRVVPIFSRARFHLRQK